MYSAFQQWQWVFSKWDQLARSCARELRQLQELWSGPSAVQVAARVKKFQEWLECHD
ncbi:PPE domain-containing protein [Mycobacterium haemophilum DSM 44634]|nr:PPE domain-containing protein [Mycobacterium haemophilum DSM 44634]